MVKHIFKNFLSLISAHSVYKLLLFFTFVVIARNLGVEDFGLLSFIISFVGLFLVLLDLGLNELLIRDVAGKIEQMGAKYVNNILGLKLFLSLVTFGVMILCASLLFKARQTRFAFLILGLSLILDSYTLFFRSIFRLFEKMEYESVSLIPEAFLKFIFIITAAKYFGLGLLTIAFILASVSFIILLFTMAMISKNFVRLGLSFNYEFYKHLLKRALPFALIAFFGVINFKLSIIIISLMVNNITTGWYSVAVRLLEPVLIIPVTAAIVLFSTSSRLYKVSKNSIFSLYQKSLKSLLGVSLPVVLLINIFANKIILLLFGKPYSNSAISLRILSLSLLPFFIKFYLERFILILDRPKIICFSYSLGTLMFFILGILLVKILGYLGVAVSLVFSEFFIVGYNFIWIQSHIEKIQFKPDITTLAKGYL